MQRKVRYVIAGGAVVAAAALVGGGIAVASSDDDGHEVPITGAELERASAAALAHTGSGRVTETEKGDEESLYEVEVTRPDGSQVDVQLDENFQVVGTKSESGNDD